VISEPWAFFCGRQEVGQRGSLFVRTMSYLWFTDDSIILLKQDFDMCILFFYSKFLETILKGKIK